MHLLINYLVSTPTLKMTTKKILYFSSELTNRSKEILFEVWNESHSKELFLGLGIVSTEELQLSQSQRMIIPLQGNPAFRPGLFIYIFSAVCLHCLLFVIYVVQLIVIKWQLSVTPKELPDRGEFPFENGVKKCFFTLCLSFGA